MTREEAKKIIGENATDEQVTTLLNAFHNEHSALEKQVTSLEGQVTNLTSENTDLQNYKAQIEELEKAKLSEQEKLNLEKEEIAKMRKETATLLNSTKAKSILVGAGISDEEADKLVATIVKDDEATTLASANLLASQFNSLREATSKKTRDELANLNIKPTPSNLAPDATKVSTWEDFSKLSAKEQEQFIKDHPEDFEKL